MKENNFKVILSLILLIGAILRFWGIQYGLPGIYNSDESLHLLNVLYMGATKNPQPLYFLYPTAFHLFLLPFYAIYYLIGLSLGVFKNSADLAASYAINPTGLFLVGRMTAAAFGVATGYLTWAISRRRFTLEKGEKPPTDISGLSIGVWATVLLMLSYVHAERSHWLLLEAPLAFACTWALYWILRASESGQKKYAIIAGLLTGLAISVKYNAGFLLVPLVIGLLRPKGKVKWDKAIYLVFLAGAACIAGFLIGTPSIVWSGNKFLDIFQYQRMVMQTGWIGQSSGAGIMWPLTELLKSDTSIGLIMIAGTIAALFRWNRTNLLLLSFVIPTLIYLSTFKTTFVRYLIPIIPAMAILGGYFLNTVFTRFSAKWAYLMLGIILLVPLGKILLLDIRLCNQDTRRAAEVWFEQNVESASTVAYENYVYGPNLFDPERLIRNFPVGDNGLSSGLMERLKVEKTRRSWYHLINFRETLAEPVFPDSLGVTKVKLFKKDPYLREVYSSRYKSFEKLKAEGAQYIVLSSDNYFRYFQKDRPDQNNPLRPYFNHVRQFYRSVIQQQGTKLVIEFTPKFWNIGPDIKIYVFK